MIQRHPSVSLESVPLPDRLYFKIGEVSRIAGIPAYILRYWESEFETLQPKKSRSGQRLYRKKDVEAVLQIKRLLYQEGFTIAGARLKFRASGEEKGQPQERNPQREDILKSLKHIREGLEKISHLLNKVS